MTFIFNTYHHPVIVACGSSGRCSAKVIGSHSIFYLCKHTFILKDADVSILGEHFTLKMNMTFSVFQE